MAGEVVVRLARPGDARAIAEVSVASRRWSYRDLLGEGDLNALSVEKTTVDFAQGLDGLPDGAAVVVAERAAVSLATRTCCRAPMTTSPPEPQSSAAST
jgi:hypothetical protein